MTKLLNWYAADGVTPLAVLKYPVTKPGESGSVSLTLKNDGDETFDVRLLIGGVADDPSAGYESGTVDGSSFDAAYSTTVAGVAPGDLLNITLTATVPAGAPLSQVGLVSQLIAEEA